MGLIEDYEAYKETASQKQQYSLEQEYAKHREELAQGGAIKQGKAPRNPPVGALVGGVTGAVMGMPAGPFGMAAGGVLGAAGGEAVQQLTERAIGSPAAPQTTGEAASRMLEESGLQLVGEGVGRLAGKVLAGRQLFKPTAMTPEGAQAMRYMEPRIQPGMLPAQVTESRPLDILHNIAEHSLIGGGAMQSFNKNQEGVFQGIADEMIDSLGRRLSPDEAGRAARDVIQGNLEANKIPAKMIYNSIESAAAPGYTPFFKGIKTQRDTGDVTKTYIDQVNVDKNMTNPKSRSVKVGEDDAGDDVYKTIPAGEPELRGMKVAVTTQDVKIGERLERLQVWAEQGRKITAGAKIDMRPVKSAIANALEIAKEAGGLEDRNMGTTLLRFIDDRPDIVSYPAAKQIRTEVRTLQQTLENSIEAKGSPAIGKAKAVYAQLTNAIRNGLKDYDPFLADMWDEANMLEKSSQMQFNNKLVRSMFNKMDEMRTGAPEAMVKEVFKPNSPTTINRVKNAIASENTWNKVLSVELQDLMRQGVDAEGKLNGRALDEAMFGRNGIGMQGMIAAYGPQRVAQYKELINALSVAEAKQGEKIGSVAVQLKQPGAVMQLTGAGLALAGVISDDYSTEGALLGGTIVLGPAIIARAMTNPTTARMILDGFKIPANTPKGMALAGRIASLAIPRIEPKAAPDTAERRFLYLPTQLMENQL